MPGAHVERVSATGTAVVSPNFDVVTAAFMLTGGVHVSVENHWLLPDEGTHGFDAGIRIIGADGMLDVDLSAPDLELTTGASGRASQQDTRYWPVDAHGPGGALRAELEERVASVRDGTPPPVTGEEGLRAVAAVELAHRSIASGRVESA